MRIKALRVIAGAYGVILEGQEADVSESAGKALVDAGLAKEVGEGEPAEKKEKVTTVTISKNERGHTKKNERNS